MFLLKLAPTPGITGAPTKVSSKAPSRAPSSRPSSSPSKRPTGSPSRGPTAAPTKPPPVAAVTLAINATQGTDPQQLQQQVQMNINDLILAAITSSPTASPTSGRRRKLESQNCSVDASTTVIVPSQGLTETQIHSILQNATTTDLFSNYSSNVCTYNVDDVVVTSFTDSPTLAPTGRQCLISCFLDYIPQRIQCLQASFIVPKVNCVLAAKQIRKKCLFNAITGFCFF